MKQNPFKNVGEIHKEWTAAGVSASRTTTQTYAKATITWFKDHGIPVPNWPANLPDLNPIENLGNSGKRSPN